jgi:sigma-B regulation protein RsbU (phosphoserine phosphatase)
MSKKKSLARQFAVLFLLFALVTTAISGYVIYNEMTETYHEECVTDLNKFTRHAVSLFGKDGSDFADLKAWFEKNPDELEVPPDFLNHIDDARMAYLDYMEEHYGGKMPEGGIPFAQLDETAQRLYMTWRFEYWFSVMLDATEEFHLSYVYFIYPTEGKELTMTYLFDPSMMVRRTGDGREVLFLGDQVYEDPVEHAVMWRTWETGEDQFTVDSVDNEYGYMYTYCQPLIINGEKVGLLCADASVDRVTETTWDAVRNLSLITGAILLAATVVLFILLGNRILKRIVLLERDVETYSRTKDPATAEVIRQKKGPNDELGSLSDRFADMIGSLDEYMNNLQKVTAEKERIGAELTVATQIQADMLPRIFPAFPERNEFDLFATMTPAKEVGGDFYDFFLIDEDHLGVVMADVSGKGVPAALFMVIAKTLIKNRAQLGASPGEVLAYANEQLCEGNDAELFVTVWMAIIEISTGRGVAVNAGHEHPVIRRKDGKYELVIYRHSPAVATMEGLRFREHEFQLNPGDSLFVYTDGVPEATNARDELFGNERMLDAINEVIDRPPEERLRHVKEAIDAFVGDAPQFDDITMLCMDYLGPDKEDNMLTIDAKIENLDDVLAFVDERLESLDCPIRKKMQIDVAVEELFVNIASYAYAPNVGTATIQVSAETDPHRVSITLSDSGVPYNPLLREDPDVSLPAEKRGIGGLGIFMVKQSMDDMTYEYRDGRNIITITKNLD